jgi:deoxyribodipyrimidine photo-lyase
MAGAFVLLNHNLRLHDNLPLHHAAAEGPVIPVFIFDETNPKQWHLGGASKWWLHHSLKSLNNDLRILGSQLIIRQGNSYLVLKDLIEETGFKDVYFEQSLLPSSTIPEERIYKLCKRFGGQAKRYRGQTLFHPSQVQTKDKNPYKVFTPFWNSCLKNEAVPDPLPVPDFQSPEEWPETLSVDDLNLLPTTPDWSTSIAETWHPGETNARIALDKFITHSMAGYDHNRDMPSLVSGTSKLSPHLHFGEISPATIWHQAKHAINKHQHNDTGGKTFLKEVGWREFSYHLLYHFPDMDHMPLNKTFLNFPWVTDDEALKAWQNGQTGYPIIDAGMRQLWQTGWMHNRVRMITASFLVKNLRIHWIEGIKWFWDTLIDADLASNTASWQWIAGCGADAAPYFRIFNPTLQGKKFDPYGDYVRHFLPELRDLPDQYIHEPWKTPKAVLDDANIELGKTYPNPIVDHKVTREAALAAYQETKSNKAITPPAS